MNNRARISKEAQINEKKEYIEEKTVEAFYEKAKEDAKTRESYSHLDPDAILSAPYDYKTDQELDRRAREDIEKNLPMIDRQFSKHCPVMRFQVYAFLAAAKNGKTSVASAMAHALYKSGEKVLIISNEEMQKDVLGRIAALDLGYNYNSFILGKIENRYVQEAIEKKRQDVSRLVTVVSSSNGVDTQDADVVCKIIEGATNKDYSAIIIDYVSKISKRSLVRVDHPWMAQEYLINYLDETKRRTDKEFPAIIVFSQVQEGAPKNPKPLKERMEGRKTLINIATGVYEIKKQSQIKETFIIIHQTRWYSGVDVWFFDFKSGHFVSSEKNEKVKI